MITDLKIEAGLGPFVGFRRLLRIHPRLPGSLQSRKATKDMNMLVAVEWAFRKSQQYSQATAMGAPGDS